MIDRPLTAVKQPAEPESTTECLYSALAKFIKDESR